MSLSPWLISTQFHLMIFQHVRLWFLSFITKNGLKFIAFRDKSKCDKNGSHNLNLLGFNPALLIKISMGPFRISSAESHNSFQEPSLKATLHLTKQTLSSFSLWVGSCASQLEA